MLTKTLLLLSALLLGLTRGLREIDAVDVIPDADYTTVRPEGYALHGTIGNAYIGYHGHNLGDINGDGLDDLIFTQWRHEDTGRAVVVFGRANRASMDDTTASSAPNGFQITSNVTGVFMGYSTASGDYNNDGHTDILISATNSADPGFVALIWGRADNSWTDITVSYSMDASVGVIIASGARDQFFGLEIVHLGDFNDDTYDDFAVGARSGDYPAYANGVTYVVFGGDLLPTDEPLDETNCLVINGAAMYDQLGNSVAAVDFNNDSVGDLIVGSFGVEANTGRTYVLLGSSTREVGELSLTGFTSSDSAGLYIDGDMEDRYFGNRVAGGCDINGDGFQDIIIAGTTNSIDVPGIAVVLFGRASGYSALNVTTLTSEEGFIITSSGDDDFGVRVGCLGRVDDDKYDDYFVAYKVGDYATTIFYGREEFSDFTILEEEPYSQEIINTNFAFEAGNHLGNGTTAWAFTYYGYSSNKGVAFMFEDVPSLFLTESPTVPPTATPTTMSPSTSPTVSPTMSPTSSPSTSPTVSPTESPTSSPTTSPTAAPTTPQCDISISTTGGDGLTWDVTDDEGDEEIASGEFGGEAMDFTLLASEEYLLFLSSDTVPAGTSITVTINGQDTVILLEQGLTTSTEIAGVTCEAISNKIASIDSGYSSTSVLFALLMAFI